MAYRKRQSKVLEKAQVRLRGLQAVHPTLDLGNGLTLQSYANLLETLNARLEQHNLSLAATDRTRIELSQMEAQVSAVSSRLLSAVAVAFGRDSKEYEMAGGKPHPASKRRSSVSGASLNGSAVSGAVISNGVVMNGVGG